MTEKEIYQKLGLRNPATFAMMSISRNAEMRHLQPSELFRQTGRTTLLLVSAISAALRGEKVFIKALQSNAMPFMMEKLRDMLAKLDVEFKQTGAYGIDVGKGQLLISSKDPSTTWVSHTCSFYDSW